MTEKNLIISSSGTLEQFVNHAKTLDRIEHIVDLVKQVIESPNVYSFSEFLEMPNITNICNTDARVYYDLLKLFAFGTYTDYSKNRHNFPDLSYNATNKLRHLTIVSLASKCRTISYSILSKELDISNLRELEDLIIEGFYANIIKGKLDQQNNQLEIDFSIGRDVTDQNIDEVLNILEEWGSNCTIALKTIETQIANANNYKQQQLELQNNIETEVSNLKKTLKIQSNDVESLSRDGDKMMKKMPKSNKTKHRFI